MDFINLNSSWFRPFVFIICFAILGFLELVIPRRKLSSPKLKRWYSNFSLSLINTIVIRVLFPFSLAIVASKAQQWNIGLFNLIKLPIYWEYILGLILFDILIFLQHMAFHKISILWKFHSVHHADIDLDVSSGNRFHTIEIFLSFLLKSIFVLIIGPSITTIILFEVILNSMAMFNHSNIHIPDWIERWLRLLIVTPDMHRVHHSIEKKELNTNFGFNLSLWDMLLKTYKEAPALGHSSMKIGLPYYRTEEYISPLSLLGMPFLKKKKR